MPHTHLGVFRSQIPLDRKQLAVLQSLETYYTPEVLRTVLVPIITQTRESSGNRLSLRALDWLATNLAKKSPIIYKWSPAGRPECIVNIYSMYRTWLWKHRRSRFDPFRRRARLTFTLDDVEYTTTVGQLNFMYWASMYGVLHYARTHLTEIERDHAESMRTKSPHEPDVGAGKRKRRQLSTAPRKRVFVFNSTVKVGFNPYVENK